MAFARTVNWRITIEPRWSFEEVPAVDTWDVEGVVTQVYSKEFEQRVRRQSISATNVSNAANMES